MDNPIPKHLAANFSTIGDENTEFSVTGNLICKCGSEDLVLHFVGDASAYKSDQVIRVVEKDGNYFLIIKAYCPDCKSQHLVFDNDLHGWNGFVCGGDNREAPRPETTQWACDACGNDTHKIGLVISSEGKEDFIDQCGDEFDAGDWAEGFSWLSVKTACISCGKSNPEWISYETM